MEQKMHKEIRRKDDNDESPDTVKETKLKTEGKSRSEQKRAGKKPKGSKIPQVD